MDYIDSKYIGFIGVRLEQFKKKGKALWNCRCPICGDSSKDKNKARGFLFEHKADVMYKCHNCGIAMGLQQFIEHVDPNMKKEYVLEKFGKKNKRKEITEPTNPEDFFKSASSKFSGSAFKRKEWNAELTRVDKLAKDHPAYKYVESRKLPIEAYSRLYYTDTFQAWTNTQVKNKFENIKKDEARLVIPFISPEGKLMAFQGRSLDPQNKLRYITIKITEDECKLFGLDKVDLTRSVFVTEGPLDSLFIDNAIAMAGSDFSNACNLNSDTDFVIVMDNENRNKEIVNKIEAFIDKGYSVCIWDEKIEQKDINDMVLAGMTPYEVMDSIKTHTYKGLTAKLALTKWRRT